eukprot:m.163602 g.163602  ORF g.163602 m.163602 type:complete len:605 (-) comp17693_c0_seq2:126-1940(-)
MRKSDASVYENADDSDEDDPILSGEAARELSRSVNRRPSWVRRRLEYHERLTTSPFQKFSKYGKFPFKLFFSVMVVVFGSTYTVARNSQFASFDAASAFTLRVLLRDLDDDLRFSSSSEVCGNIGAVTQDYFQFPDNSVHAFEVNQSVSLTVSFYNSSTIETQLVPGSGLDPLGDVCADSRGLQDVESIVLVYLFNTTFSGSVARVAVLWQALATYSMGRGGGVATYRVDFYAKLRSWSNHILTVLNATTATMAFFSLVLTLKSFLKARSVYNAVRARLSFPARHPGQLVWSQLTYEDKLAFFNLWNVLSITADMLLIIGAGFTFRWQSGTATVARNELSPEVVCRGLGLFLAWFSIIKYMEWRAELYMLVNVVKASIVQVILFVITVAPLYIGYVFLGMIVFSNKEDFFGDLSRSSATLFALLNGDSILMIFQELQERSDAAYAGFTQFYVYTFCVIFITTVLNVFIFLIEAGYDTAHAASFGKRKKFILDNVRLKQIIDAAYQRDNESGIATVPMQAEGGNLEELPTRREMGATFDLPPPPMSRRDSPTAVRCTCQCQCGALEGPVSGKLTAKISEIQEQFVLKCKELQYAVDGRAASQSEA